MNFDVYIPVRLQSTRLPQKAMKEIDGKPIIQYLVERISTAKKIRNVIVCTTIDKSDNKLVAFLKKKKIKSFRGNKKDILVRFLDAAKHFGTDFIICVDGDDIYSDPLYVDEIVTKFKKSDADCVQIVGIPLGFTPIGIRMSALQKICRLKIADNTETGYGRFFTETNLFKVYKLKPAKKIEFPTNLRLSLDYQEDFDLAKKIFKKLGNNFHMEDVLNLINEEPESLKKDVENRWNKHWDVNLSDISIKDM